MKPEGERRSKGERERGSRGEREQGSKGEREQGRRAEKASHFLLPIFHFSVPARFHRVAPGLFSQQLLRLVE